MPYESIPRWRQSPNCLQISSSWFLPTFDGGLTRQKCDLSKRANDQTQLEYSSFFAECRKCDGTGTGRNFLKLCGIYNFVAVCSSVKGILAARHFPPRSIQMIRRSSVLYAFAAAAQLFYSWATTPSHPGHPRPVPALR